MAGTHKTTAGSRKAGGSKNTKRKTSKTAQTAKKRASDEHYDSEMRREVYLLLILAAAAILALSNFGVCGAFGKAVSGMMFGVFGWMAYIFPFYLFFGAAFLVSNGFSVKAVIKFTAATVLYLFICMLSEMLFMTYREGSTLADYYKESYTFHRGGGLAGGALLKFLRPFFGTVGSYIMAAAVILMSAVLITECSLIKGVKKGSAHLYEAAKEDAIRVREESRVRQEEKRQKKEQRIDKKVKGVVLADLDSVAGTEENTLEGMPLPEESLKEALEVEAEAAILIEPEPLKEESLFMPEIAGSDMSEEIVDYTVNLQEFEPDFGAESENGKKKEQIPVYHFPSLKLLKKGRAADKSGQPAKLKETANKLKETLHSFGVEVTITDISCGPSVTRYELQPQQGVKVSKIVSLADDIKLNLAAADIRIEAPIPGKAAIGIEVPNKENATVMLRDLLESAEFKKHPSKLAFAVGKDIGGQTVVADIAKMPHLLIAGATGSGKSVCINTLIMSILYKAKPEEVKLIMIDPKVVELSVYNDIPHLLIPVVTDLKKAAGALNWAVAEMTDRYNKFAEWNVRDLKGYNERITAVSGSEEALPHIVIIVDELADLMMVAPKDVEDAICRLAQLARAAGIHLVIATQRPSVNVITGLIKANIPSRIAFSVSSGVDSRTIIDMNGAEKLLGRGDMLFYPVGMQKPVRVQGAFVSDKEVGDVVDFLVKETSEVQYNEEIANKIASAVLQESGQQEGTLDKDDYFKEAGRFIIEKEKASIGMLQRMFKIGFNRAARIMDQLADAGVVGPEEGTKPRKILMTMEEFETYCEKERRQ